MSVECPAAGCDYSGHLDAVEGHLGGVADKAHRGVVPADLRKSLDGKGSEGLAVGLALVVVVAVLLLYWSGSDEQEEGGTDESEASEGAETPEAW